MILFTIHLEKKKYNFFLTAMKTDIELLLISIESGALIGDEFGSVVVACIQIVNVMKRFHGDIIDDVFYNNEDLKIKEEFFKK